MRLEKTVSVIELFDNFFDENASLKLCEKCEYYGSRWSCPPFEKPIEFGNYKKATLFLRRVENRGDFFRTFLDAREDFDKQLLSAEKGKTGSLAFFAGSCVNCELKECARKSAKPCPFDNMRTSLEAVGFDVGKIAEKIFNVKIEWEKDGKSPQNLTLLGALFFD